MSSAGNSKVIRQIGCLSRRWGSISNKSNLLEKNEDFWDKITFYQHLDCYEPE